MTLESSNPPEGHHVRDAFRVAHLVPYDGIGGVESAARSMIGAGAPCIDFRLHFIYDVPSGKMSKLALFSPWPPLRAALRLVAEEPDLVIVSLWRSCIAALIAKLLRPKLRLVLFLHLVSDAHLVDRALTRLTAALATQVWADSEQTRTERLPKPAHRVISFVVAQTVAKNRPVCAPEFMFWGRLHPQKNIPRALNLFLAVQSRLPQARFRIIGPDGGDRARIESEIARLKLGHCVTLEGPLPFEDISRLAQQAAFYLQTSDSEGMAMSVAEAMQLGLVPVVTPAGEIARYCQNGKNAVIVDDVTEAAQDVLSLLEDPARLIELRDAAIKTWDRAQLYSDSVLEACRDLRDAR